MTALSRNIHHQSKMNLQQTKNSQRVQSQNLIKKKLSSVKLSETVISEGNLKVKRAFDARSFTQHLVVKMMPEEPICAMSVVAIETTKQFKIHHLIFTIWTSTALENSSLIY